MSTSTFGEVIQHDTDQGQSQPVNGSAGEAVQLIDPNDPRLTSEVISCDTEADAYATPPPLPDGKWRAKAKQVDIKDDKGQQQRYAVFSRPKMANGAPFFATNIEFSIIDHSGAFDGIKLTEYWVKTLTDTRKGISQAETMVKKLGGKLAASGTQKQKIDALLSTLAGEPELIVETAWSAECMTCQEVAKKKGDRAPRPFLQGMHRFPATKVPGERDPMVTCPTCKSQVRAQVRIANFFSLAEAKADRGTGTPHK